MSTAGIHPARVDERPLRVLIHRVGSLGDTLVAIPLLRLIAAAYPRAERILLCNEPVSSVAAPAAAVLQGLGLIHGEARYAARGGFGGLLEVLRATRKARPDVVISLSAKPGRRAALRDWIFFKLAGADHVIGLGLGGRALQPVSGSIHEREAQRLQRTVRALGSIDWHQPAAWTIPINEPDRVGAARAQPDWDWQAGYFCVAMGTKAPSNDWGQPRWLELIGLLAQKGLPLKLVCIGAAEDRVRADQLLAAWPERLGRANLCGQLSVRETAAVLQRSRLLLGHDSGPMHLAAAVGTPILAIFSRRNPLGKWFPFGSGHATMYSDVPCAGCGLVVCPVQNLCTQQIAAADAARQALAILNPNSSAHA